MVLNEKSDDHSAENNHITQRTFWKSLLAVLFSFVAQFSISNGSLMTSQTLRVSELGLIMCFHQLSFQSTVTFMNSCSQLIAGMMESSISQETWQHKLISRCNNHCRWITLLLLLHLIITLYSKHSSSHGGFGPCIHVDLSLAGLRLVLALKSHFGS